MLGTYKIVICDDLASDRASLLALLLPRLQASGITGAIVEFESGEALIAEYEEKAISCDCIFLDIFMDGMNGIETARRIRRYDDKVAIVFLTTSPDFALDSYDVFASGYLVKPVCSTRLNFLMERLLDSYEESDKRLLLKKGSRTQCFLYSDIVYIESRGNVLTLHDRQGEEFSFYGKLTDIEQQIDDSRFLRCHQSYLVNMTSVQSAEDDFVMRDGTRIPIKVRERRSMRNKYFEFVVASGIRSGKLLTSH